MSTPGEELVEMPAVTGLLRALGVCDDQQRAYRPIDVLPAELVHTPLGVALNPASPPGGTE